MFSVSMTSRMASLLLGGILFGCIASAQDTVSQEYGEDFYCNASLHGVLVSEDDEGGVCHALPGELLSRQDMFLIDEDDLGDFSMEPKVDFESSMPVLDFELDVAKKGPHFSEGYHFFSRAGIVQVGIVMKQFARHLSSLSGGAYDIVLPTDLLALVGNYLYVTMRMMENAALQDKDTVDGISWQNWVGLSRLYVYFFQTLNLGALYMKDMYRISSQDTRDSGVVCTTYGRSVPWVGLALAVYDFQGKLDKVMDLGEPQTDADWSAYYKAWNGLYVYGAKLLATSIPWIVASPKWKPVGSSLSLAAALGFLWADLSNPNG